MEDWRLQGQEKYLQGVSLSRKKYTKYNDTWTHDHCEFCWKTFSENTEDTNEGYVTADNYRWICDDCFKDFKAMFKWTILEESEVTK